MSIGHQADVSKIMTSQKAKNSRDLRDAIYYYNRAQKPPLNTMVHMYMTKTTIIFVVLFDLVCVGVLMPIHVIFQVDNKKNNISATYFDHKIKFIWKYLNVPR